MDGKLFARVGAGIFVAITITATAIEMARETPPAERPAAVMRPAQASDPLRAALIRCQQLGEVGVREPSCLRAWAENRRRFLAPGARPAERLAAPTRSDAEP